MDPHDSGAFLKPDVCPYSTAKMAGKDLNGIGILRRPLRSSVGRRNWKRNRLIPAYFDVDPDIVWDTATQDLPLPIAALTKLPGEAEE